MPWPADMSPYTVVLLTFLTELFLYTLMSPLVLRQFKAYRTAKSEVQQKLKSCPASLLVTLPENVLSLYIFFCRPDVSPVKYEPNLLVRQVAGIWLGRILAEFLLTIQQPILKWDVFLHHVVSVVAGCTAVCVGEMPWHTNLGLLMELSNPFFNVRIAMMELVPRTSPLFVINDTCFVTVFFLCRIATIPLYWYCTLPVILSGKIFEFEWLTVIGALGFHTVFELMSVYWFGKMVRIVAKFVSGDINKEL